MKILRKKIFHLEFMKKDFPNNKVRGLYSLIIFIKHNKEIQIGALGVKKLYCGYYIYTGSAMGIGSTSLYNRISRHLKENKKKRWHIDYLTSNDGAIISDIIFVVTNKRMECRINKELKNNLEGKNLIPNFGSSDCKKKCKSHLIYLGVKKKVQMVYKTYYENTKLPIYHYLLKT